MIIIGVCLIVSMLILFVMSSKVYAEIQDIASMQRESLEKYKKRRDRYIKAEPEKAEPEAVAQPAKTEAPVEPSAETIAIVTDEKKLTEGETVDHGY